MNPSLTAHASTALAGSLHRHWRLYLAEGIVLGLLGLAAIMLPFIAGLAGAVLFGWVFLLAGAAGLVMTLRTRRAPGFVWSMLSAILALIAGAVLLWSPLAGLITLTYVLTVFFLIDGLFMIVLALSHRRELAAKWEWMLINGVIDLFLAGVIVFGFPGSLIWAFGLIVGADLLFGGAALAVVALGARAPSVGAVSATAQVQ
jgi:uncharacterized membrane protein HdeD (DUF308 family)